MPRDTTHAGCMVDAMQLCEIARRGLPGDRDRRGGGNHVWAWVRALNISLLSTRIGEITRRINKVIHAQCEPFRCTWPRMNRICYTP